MAMELPRAIEIPGPGTTRIRIGASPTPKRVNRLQLERRVQRIRGQLHPPEGHWEQGLNREFPQAQSSHGCHDRRL